MTMKMAGTNCWRMTRARSPERPGQIKSDIDPASKSIGRNTMIRTFPAMAIAGLVLVAVAGISQAAPIAPLPAGVMPDQSNVMQVRWHRRCWRSRDLLLRYTERSHRQNAGAQIDSI
jgi:hypothetical protein